MQNHEDGSDEGISESSSDSSDSESAGEELEMLPRQRSALEEYFSVVVEIIDRLYKSSMAIRDPAIRTRSSKAATFVDRDESGNDRLKIFEHFAITQAKHQMKEWKKNWILSPGDEELAIRLGKANTRRRQQLLYEKRHAKKLAQIEDIIQSNVNEDSVLAPMPATVLERTTHDTADVSRVQASSPSPQARGTILSRTTATDYVPRPSPLNRPTSLVSAATTFSGYISHDVVVPLPPAHTVEKAFQCPYCYMILPASAKDDLAWTRHVMQDLQPYVCLFSPCEHNGLFETTADWMQHQQWSHSLVWVCNDSSHPHEVFECPEDFEQHLRHSHTNAFDESQLPVLIDAGKQPSATVFSNCPLCGWEPVEMQEKPLARFLPSEVSRKDPKTELEKHVAVHLRQSAMVALPALCSNGESDVGERESQDSQSKNAASQQDSGGLSFPVYDDSSSISERLLTTYLDPDFSNFEPSLELVPDCEDSVSLVDIYGITTSNDDKSTAHLISSFAYEDTAKISTDLETESATAGATHLIDSPPNSSNSQIVVSVLGVEGCGKSTIVRPLCLDDPLTEYDRTVINTYSFSASVIIVDTPEITSSFHDEIFVLSQLAAYLRSHEYLYPLSGIIYIHALDAPTIYCLPSYTFKMFRSLCGGGETLERLLLLTIGWGNDGDNVGSKSKESRILQSENMWAPLLRAGAKSQRLRLGVQGEVKRVFQDFVNSI